MLQLLACISDLTCSDNSNHLFFARRVMLTRLWTLDMTDVCNVACIRRYFAGFQSLTEDTQQVLGLLTELLQSPVLPDNKIQLVKNQVHTSKQI